MAPPLENGFLIKIIIFLGNNIRLPRDERTRGSKKYLSIIKYFRIKRTTFVDGRSTVGFFFAVLLICRSKWRIGRSFRWLLCGCCSAAAAAADAANIVNRFFVLNLGWDQKQKRGRTLMSVVETCDGLWCGKTDLVRTKRRSWSERQNVFDWSKIGNGSNDGRGWGCDVRRFYRDLVFHKSFIFLLFQSMSIIVCTVEWDSNSTMRKYRPFVIVFSPLLSI